jgi:hypothetical protein
MNPTKRILPNTPVHPPVDTAPDANDEWLTHTDRNVCDPQDQTEVCAEKTCDWLDPDQSPE